MIILIDNYDSFSYNLADLFNRQIDDLKVVRNDKISLNEISNWNPRGIIISPGPGRPENAGICPQIFDIFGGKIPFLGVCLGHQLLGLKSGAIITKAASPMHGKTSEVLNDGKGIFKNLPCKIKVMRYHSLIVNPNPFASTFSNFGGNYENSCLIISAQTIDGEIMALRHRTWRATESVQFHPESILSENGEEMVNNWIQMINNQS